MSTPTLLVTPGPVTTVTLNRPDVRNAFNEELMQALTDWATSVPADGSVRAVVLQGAGSVFCAGADVQWMSKMVNFSHEENLADAHRAAMMLHAIDSVPVPVIGRIQARPSAAAPGSPASATLSSPAKTRSSVSPKSCSASCRQ